MAASELALVIEKAALSTGAPIIASSFSSVHIPLVYVQGALRVLSMCLLRARVPLLTIQVLSVCFPKCPYSHVPKFTEPRAIWVYPLWCNFVPSSESTSHAMSSRRH